MAPDIDVYSSSSSYPAIEGYTSITGITLANFDINFCGVRDVAFEINPDYADAFHPVGVRDIELVDVDYNSLALFHPPNPRWINPTDCIDMDCDGPKHALIEDLDGTLGFCIVARAEYFSENAVGAMPPLSMFIDELGFAHPEAEVIPNGYGIPMEGCTLNPNWNAWNCPSQGGLSFSMLVIESMDVDSETRRLTPIALSSGGWTDLINGGMDHGWCFGYTCLKRLDIKVFERHPIPLFSPWAVNICCFVSLKK